LGKRDDELHKKISSGNGGKGGRKSDIFKNFDKKCHPFLVHLLSSTALAAFDLVIPYVSPLLIS
jgi:hypothetical protein